MDTGVAIFPTHDAIAPADMARPVYLGPTGLTARVAKYPGR
jgi:hypothetical protein